MNDSTVTITITAVDGATKVFKGVGDEAVKQANRSAAAWQKANAIQSVSIESTGKLGKAAGNAANQQERLANATRRSYIAQTALTTVLSASINKAFLEMVDVTGQAIQRVDLLAQFPASMAALGLSAADASDSMARLSDYVGSIGGNLQDATTTVARFAEVTKNVKAATAEFVGVNNALIAGGAPAQVQASALEQLTQAYSRGIPQLIEWRSMMVAMPAQLNAVAQSMGHVNAQSLGEALTNGKISMQAFMTELTKLSTNGGPIMAQAEARMNGIQFAFNKFKNTMVAGMTEVIQTIGRQNITDVFSLMAQVIRQVTVYAVQLVSVLFTVFNFFSRLFGGPQLKLAKDNTAAIADNIGAGADHAGDLADGLDDAGKSAKKLQKGLAAFDKMNVLADKDSGGGGGKDTPSPGAGLGAADAAALEDIFGNIGGKLDDISTAAKILAGILTGLAANALLKKLFGLDPLGGLLKGIKDATKGFLGLGKTAEEAGGKASKSFGTKFGEGLRAQSGKATSAVAGFLGGVAGAVGGALAGAFGALAGFITTAFAFIGAVVIETLIALGVLAAGVTVPLWALVAIGVAVVAAIIGLIWLIWANWDTIIQWIKTAAIAVWDFLVAVWNGIVGAIQTVWNFLYDIFGAPIKWLIQFWEALGILIVAIIAIALELIFKLVVGAIKLIYTVLAAIAGWINDNVIQPVWQFFQWLWDTITNAVIAAWQWIFENVLRPIGSWIYNNVITPVLNFFIGLWNGVVNLAVGMWNGIKNVLSPFANWIKSNIIDPVLGFFNWLWDKIKGGLDSMVKGLATLFGNITGFVKAPINGIIDLINNVLKQLNKVKVPDWVPGLGGKGVNFPLIPKLARGGIVTRSQLVNVGEAGAEAIVPLENNLEWLDKLAEKINRTGNGQPVQLVVNIGEETIVTKVVELINEKTQMSGRNAILV